MAGNQSYLRSQIQNLSKRLGCCIVRADAGKNETAGQGGHISYDLIVENGVLLTESRDEENGVLACDVDVQLLENERRETKELKNRQYTKIYFDLKPCLTPILRNVNPGPFVLDWHENRDEWCADIIEMQADYLVRRIETAGYSAFVVPLDGGIDTTIAAMACARATKKLGWEDGNVIGIITLCEGITKPTTNRAIGLARNLNFSQCHCDINEQWNKRLEFLGVDKKKEQELAVKIRERIRFGVAEDIADQIGGMLVLGYNMTSIALGEVYTPTKSACWINASIPKTVMRFLLIYIMTQQEELRQLIMVLQAVLAETAGGASPNQSADREAAEQIIFTPLQMNDFFLYHVIKHGFGPLKLMRLAEKAFGKQLDQFRVYDCLKKFFERFLNEQSTHLWELDAPKLIEPSLIGYHISMDMDFRLWFDELESLKPDGYEEADLSEPELSAPASKNVEYESEEEKATRIARMKRMEELALKEIEREREEERRRGSGYLKIDESLPSVSTAEIKKNEIPKTPEEFAQQMEQLQKLAMEQIEREREAERNK